ncbi:MAG: ribosome recycling factor [Candidatus Cloacimonetes bacterium 4572_55]|nr:MAG: ribosome recycling factor [Candidatus Cloacimonetes bacterium 4572_55]
MIKKVLEDAKVQMRDAETAMTREFAKVRTGKATASLLDNIKVDYYGSMVPISQAANIGVPEPRMLTIQPWDKNMMSAIERAILQSDLGITPSNDGNFIRLPIPALTEERRRNLVKIVHKSAEEGRVSVRGARRDAIQKLKAAKKKSDITEDDLHRGQDDVQELTDASTKNIDKLMKQKEKEIMEV